MGGITNGAKLTDALATEYMTAPSDDAVRENVKADRAFLNLTILTFIPGLLLYLG